MEKPFPKMKINKQTLNKVGLKHKTDKASHYHDYLRYYDRFIDFRPAHILEVGVLKGNSLRMWHEYFQCTVYGVDINPDCQQHEDGDIHVRIGNQTSRKFLDSVCEEILPERFDLIVDDGCHESGATLKTFDILFPWLRPGGMYICEDTCCSYWPEFTTRSQTPIEFFKTVVDEVNWNGLRDHSDARAFKTLREHVEDAPSVYPYEFIIFINSAVLIKKRPE